MRHEHTVIPGYLRHFIGATKFEFGGGGGGSQEPPKPPAPPTKDDAAKSVLNMGKPKKGVGIGNTILSVPTLGKPDNGGKTALGQ